MFKQILLYFSAKPVKIKTYSLQELDQLEEICANQWWGSGTLKPVESEDQR